MSRTGAENAAAWELSRVVDFFTSRRNATAEVYESEWFFIKDQLRDGMSVLDVGSALGGFAAILAEHLAEFRYTGADISSVMIERARELHPNHTFHLVAEGDLSPLGGECYDLVLVLGILHLHEAWRDTVRSAWAHTGRCLILDLRQCDGPSIEDRTRSWFQMDFNGGDDSHRRARLPYNVINAAEALGTIHELCPGAAGIAQYGYEHPVSHAATCPLDRVMATTWRIERPAR